MSKPKFVAKHLFKLLLLLAVLLSPLFFLSLPALAPTVELPPEIKREDDLDKNLFDLNKVSNIDDSMVKAKSYLVYDATTGTQLSFRAPKTVVSIASLTKLMTAYLIKKYGNVNDVITIQKKDELNINPVLGLKAGDKVSVNDLLNSLLIGSANDAAVTLGSYLELKQSSKVEALMNAEAEALGMSDTHFNNPIGFDSDTNYSTAVDLKILITELQKKIDFSLFDRKNSYSFSALNEVQPTGASQNYFVKATNRLVAAYPDIRAVKTGFTDDAQGAMVVGIDTDKNGSSAEYYIIILQSSEREQDTLLLREIISKTFYGTGAAQTTQPQRTP